MRSSALTAVTTCGSVTGDRRDHMWLRHRYHIQTSDFVAFHSLQHLPCRCYTPVLMKREPDVSPTFFSSGMYYNTRTVEDTVVSDDMKHFLQYLLSM